MAKRFTATFKASGAPTTQGRQQNACFFYLADDAPDATAIAAAEAIAGLCNGKLVSVTAQIMSDPDGPYPSLTANGGSDRAQLLFRSASRRPETVTIPFLRHDVEKSEVEAVFEGGAIAFLNAAGEALGQYVHTRATQIIE